MKPSLGIFIAFAIACFSNLSFAQNEFTIKGIMKHADIEGGCWYLQAKDKKYELTAPPEILQTCHVEGRALTLSVREAPMMQSICMIGHMVEVVLVLDSVLHPHNPPYTDKLVKGIVHKTKSGCWYVMATDKRRYELQPPIPKKFMKIGAAYNRMSKVIPGTEGECNMDNVITISLLEPDMIPKEAKQKKSDPR